MDPSKYTALFLHDSREHLGRCNAQLLAWEREPGRPFPVAELFRAFHSIKGSSAALGHEAIVELAHAGEQVLGAIRDGALHPSRPLVDLLFHALDGLSEGAEAVGRGERPATGPALMAALLALVPPAPVGPPPVERRAVSRSAATPPSVSGRPSAGPTTVRQVRVELERLDMLMNQANELVVARNRLSAIADREIGSELEQVSTQLSGLVSRMRGTVISARMAPVAEVFERFPRLVRDLARELGKEIRLELQGTEIELDRSILDAMGQPLTHLIRNAADHGLETPAERVAARKTREGAIRIRAERTPEEIILTVADDGRGIDRAGVLRHAIEVGILSEGASLPDASGLLHLLAHPGFTTRRQVTLVSGRGVGVDAVLEQVRSFGGRMELKTAPGRGTTVLVRLPVSRALIGVLVIRIGDERYAIPFTGIAEAAMQEAPGQEITLRGTPVPTADLRRLIGNGESSARRRPAIVFERGGRRAALVVDALLGQQDVVVEPFAAPAGLPPWIAGATILSDGAPALMLDPAALL
ncbi:MAG TPA: chemotaxis protein CheA [Gemmatimonadales bacterium]|nr:chemotaxis protein CheA [Gemmatimonadales bacterium]